MRKEYTGKNNYPYFMIRRRVKFFLNGQDISGKSTKKTRRDLAKKIQMIFQDPYACLNPRMTVSDIIAEGWDMRKLYTKEERKRKIIELLNLVGLNEEHANRFPHGIFRGTEAENRNRKSAKYGA